MRIDIAWKETYYSVTTTSAILILGCLRLQLRSMYHRSIFLSETKKAHLRSVNYHTQFGDVESHILAVESCIFSFESCILGVESCVLGVESRTPIVESRILGVESHILGVESRILSSSRHQLSSVTFTD